MNTKSVYVLALTFLFAMVSSPLYDGEAFPGKEPVYMPKTAAMEKVAGVKTFKGNITGEIVCLYEWQTEEEYQVSGSGSVCMRPRHNQRALVTEEGDIFLLMADEQAGRFVVKALTTDLIEREDVFVEGVIVEGGPIKLVKVKSLKIK
jgi:hypothetical protein